MTEIATALLTITPQSVDQLRAEVRDRPGRLFAILDATSEPRVPRKVAELGDRAVSLYRGAAERDYWAVAPYLAILDEGLLDWIIANLCADPWGILVAAAADLASLRQHFRRFLLVQEPEGRQVYFRYYDPRVLPTFLLTCARSELEQFFGPVERFYVTNEDGSLTGMTRSAYAPKAPNPQHKSRALS